MRRGRPAALAALLCAGTAAAGDPSKVAVGPGTPKGALLFNVPPLPVDYQLLFTRIDAPVSKAYFVYIKAVPTAKGERFIVTTLPPGSYLLEGLYQQQKWAACLQQRTFRVSVDAGRIAYLGNVDARPTLASIQRNAEASRQLRAEFGEWHFYRAGLAPPRISDRDPAGLARAASFVRESMPRSRAVPVLADLKWGPYETVGTTGRANRCM
jgi:hypothetical protein